MIEQINLHKKWLPLFVSDENYYILTGGRGSGKSFSISMFALTLISREAGHRIAVYRATMVSVEESIMKDMKDLVELLPDKDDFDVQNKIIIHKKTGSEIFFKGIQTNKLTNTASLKGLASCTTFILDEAEELVDLAIWRKIDDTFRTTKKQIRMILSLNPTIQEHWIYEWFFEKNGFNESKWEIPEDLNEPVKCISDGCGVANNVRFIHSTYLDNYENLAPHKAKQWDDYRVDDPEYYKHGVLGGWRSRAEGVVLPKWEYGQFPEQPTGAIVYGADWGMRDPFALVKTMVDTKTAKIYVELCHYESNLIETEWFRHTFNHAGRNQIVADGKKPEVIEGFRRKGLNIIAADQSPGSIYKGVTLLNDYTLVVCGANTKPFTKELNNYVWEDEGKKEQPKQNTGYDHAIDGARYAVWWTLTQKYSSLDEKDFYF